MRPRSADGRAGGEIPGVGGGPAALVVAHPGHELRVHGWVSAVRPLTLVLTDGSGSSSRSRLASTSRVLGECGAEPGGVYGRFTDRGLYAALLRGERDLFVALAEEIASILVDRRIASVAGDAPEGFNPAHDLCRLLINAAIEIARRTTGVLIHNFDFPLEGSPDSCPDERRRGSHVLRLDERVLRRKLDAARAYPELSAEVSATLQACGAEAFRVERFRAVGYSLDFDGLVDAPPFYERHGEARVAAGVYPRVIRQHEHLRPIAAALRGRIAGLG